MEIIKKITVVGDAHTRLEVLDAYFMSKSGEP
jgi:hypothetical protein